MRSGQKTIWGAHASNERSDTCRSLCIGSYCCFSPRATSIISNKRSDLIFALPKDAQSCDGNLNQGHLPSYEEIEVGRL